MEEKTEKNSNEDSLNEKKQFEENEKNIQEENLENKSEKEEEAEEEKEETEDKEEAEEEKEEAEETEKETKENKEETKENKDEKDNKTLLLMMAIVISTFIIFLVAGFFFSNQATTPQGPITIEEMHQQNLQGKEIENAYVYRGFSFINVTGRWHTQVQKDGQIINIPLHFGPKELEEIEIKGEINYDLLPKEIYISFNPTDENLQYVALATAELSLNLAVGMKIMPIAACGKNITEACEERPIITCESNEPVIIIEQAEKEEIIIKDNCITIKGKDRGLVKAVDRFLLRIYEVME